MQARTGPSHLPRPRPLFHAGSAVASRQADGFAGVLAGLIAGAAYLAVQILAVVLVRGGHAADPLLRIGAILLGPDAAPPGGDATIREIGMGLLIHFAYAMVAGRIVEFFTRGCAFGMAALRGAAVGGVLFVVDFLLLAPVAFPWFEGSPQLATAIDHMLFGAVAGVACAVLRGRFELR
jgi:hypothetical protein